MLTVQIIIGSVDPDHRNGSSQRRYHGYTTGAHRSDAAIGQANACGEHSGDARLSQVAIRNPTSTGSPAAICGATCSSFANTRSLKRKVCTYVISEPIGMRVWSRNGTYRNPTTAATTTASRTRIRFQYRGNSTIGRNFTETASPNARAAIARHR